MISWLKIPVGVVESTSRLTDNNGNIIMKTLLSLAYS